MAEARSGTMGRSATLRASVSDGSFTSPVRPRFAAISARGSPIRGLNGVLKRMLDIALASLLLLLLAPLLVLLAALVKITSLGPALYKRERLGLCGRSFIMLKFRSMVRDAEASEPDHGSPEIVVKSRSDPRITPFGRFLRRSSLDELPQLFNVIRGEMSLVGPRPSLEYELKRYTPLMFRRFMVKPGMTGLWQVSGRAHLPFRRGMAYDVLYVRRQSFLLDLLILARTLPAMFRMEGAW